MFTDVDDVTTLIHFAWILTPCCSLNYTLMTFLLNMQFLYFSLIPLLHLLMQFYFIEHMEVFFPLMGDYFQVVSSPKNPNSGL